MKKVLFGLIALSMFSGSAMAQDVVGSVDTAWALGGNHRVDVERVKDPILPVTCYISHPITGGFAGKFGLAKNHSLFSISCIKDNNSQQDLTKLENNQKLVSQRTSWFSNLLILNRFVDKDSKNVIYMVTAQGELIDGSPFSSVSTVEFH